MNIIEKINQVKKNKNSFMKLSNDYNNLIADYNKNITRCNESVAYINGYLSFIETSSEELVEYKNNLNDVQLILDELKALKEPAYSEALKNDYNKYADALKQVEYYKNRIESLEHYIANRIVKIHKQHILYKEQTSSLPSHEKNILQVKNELHTVKNKLIELKQSTFVSNIKLSKLVQLEPLKESSIFNKEEELQK